MAIDISAGKGTTIKSPIHGKVVANYVDSFGNTTLIIENSVYKITMLHGEYSVNVGKRLAIGQPVGLESNIGFTTDMRGVSCKNRDCGYHTHLNVFDKRRNENLDPLSLLNP
jgi:murein DD-endopeptidase MepM/ murein hydrolase activator NlpD